jgi:YD repeat-containing protein
VGTSDGGNLTTHADAGSNVTGDSWVRGDGSYGSDQIHSDGSSSGTAHYLDSSSSTSVNNGQGAITTSNYNASGVLIGTTTITTNAGTVASDFHPATAGSTDITSISGADGSFKGQVTVGGMTVGIDLDVNDGFSRIVSSGGAGTTAQLFDADGNYTGTSVETRAADGSITKTEYDPSGTETGYSQTTTDAGGQVTTTHYSLVGGVATEDSYRQTNGSTTKQYALNPDGSGTFFETGVTVVSTDVQGHVTKTEYDAYGNLVGYVREGIDTAGNVDFQEFDSAGNAVQSTTLLSTGVAENTLFLTADGQVTTTLQNDGTYSQTTDDGEGDVTTAQYNASGTLVSSSWTEGDGSSGNAVIHADGSENSFSDDGQGNLTTSVASASGQVTSVTDFYNSGPIRAASDTHDASWGLLGSTQVVTSSDGLTTTTSDFDSTGALTDSQTVVVTGGGYDITTSNFDGAGTLLNSEVQVTSTDGLVVTTTDYDGAGVETGATQVTSSADGKSTTTVQYGAGGVRTGSTSVVTSSDGMTTTTSDFDAAGAMLDYNTEVSSANGTTITTSFYNGGGALPSREVAVQSADGSTVTTSDFDSSGALVGSSVAVYGAADGSVTTTNFDASGTKTGSQIVLSSDGDINTVTTNYDATGTITGQQVELGGGVEPGNIGVSATMWHGAPALVLKTPTDSVTVPGGVDPAQALQSTVTLDHSPVNNLFDLLQMVAAQGHMQSDTITGAFGNWILDGTKGATIAAGTGADTISAWGNGDTISAGTGGDLIYAVGDYDVVRAGSNNDTLVALGHGTTLQGGSGNTLFRVNDESQSVQVAAGSGVDSIESSVSFDLPNHVDVITFTGTADIQSEGNRDSANLMTANDGNDTLYAGTGHDTLVSGKGVDVLVGGSGTDTFVINNSADIIDLSESSGFQDQALSSVSYDLTAPLDTLILTGSGNLVATDDYGYATIIGNAGNDTLKGGNGFDRIIAGTGVDTIIAGSGHNTLVVNNVADVVIGTSASRNCTIQSSVSFTLSQFLDKLTLTGSDNLVGRGNNDATNLLIANGGNDTLIAGSGSDTLQGGAGADLLVAGSGADVLEGGAGDTYQLNAGFGNTLITTSPGGSAVIAFGSGIAATDLTLGITIDSSGAAALTVRDGGGTVTVAGAFSGSISQFEFADGTHADLAELLSVAHIQSATVVGSSGNAILNAADSAAISGGFGNDTIVGVGANDTITAGTGNQLLAAYGANSEIIGGTGDDTIVAGSADDRLVSGNGHTVMSDSGTDATYTLTRGSTTTIDASGTAGVHTVVLPAGMTIDDFTSFKDFSGDLVMQSLDGATTAIIEGVYNSTAAWLVSDALNGPASLEGWAGATHHSGSSYAATIEQLRSEYAASLAPTLNNIGMNKASIGEPSNPNSFVNDYHFNGTSIQNVTVSGGSLTLPSSDNDDLQFRNVTTGSRTETYQVPVYSTENLPGGTVFIPIGTGFSNVNVTAAVPVLGPDGSVIGFDLTRVAETVTVQTGTRTVTQTIPITSTYWSETQSFVAYNITGDGGNDTITAAPNFVGTVVTGDGNVTVDLGGAGAFFSGHESLNYPDKPPLGAVIEAGAGNDLIIGTGGADTIAAGTGFDTLQGWVGSSYYVPMEGDSTDIIYAEEAYYGTGPFPHNTLVLPEGLTPADLQYKVFEDPNQVYGDDSRILQITHGQSSVEIYFAAGPDLVGWLDNAAPDDSPGINRFQFSDGTVLTRAQVLAMAGSVQPADSRDPTVTADIPAVTANTTVSAASWFTGSDTGDGHVSWYAITNDAGSGGYFVLDGKTQTAGQQFLVSENQLAGLSYVAGAAGGSDAIAIEAYDGVYWGVETDAAVSFTSGGNTPSAVASPGSHAIQWHDILAHEPTPVSLAGVASLNHAEGLYGAAEEPHLFAVKPTERPGFPVTVAF